MLPTAMSPEISCGVSPPWMVLALGFVVVEIASFVNLLSDLSVRMCMQCSDVYIASKNYINCVDMERIALYM